VELSGDEGIIVDSFPGAFSQIITNLVMNSLQHAFDEDQEGLISIYVSQEEGQLQLVYADNGKGMSHKQLRRVFEPFYTTRRSQGGSGLGAHIIYNLVTQRLGGRIDCHSNPGEGTRFEVRIPLRV
jgi:signal transduction histidine kinase